MQYGSLRHGHGFLRIRTSFLFASTALATVFLSGSVASAALPTPDRIPTDKGNVTVQPINHATFTLTSGGKTIYVDPVGAAERFKGLARPDLILITDIHQDHLDVSTLGSIVTSDTAIIAPAAVVEKLPQALRRQATSIANGQMRQSNGLTIEAVPMYNLTPERLKFHEKGRGNGYVVTLGGKRLYISGDTEDIPEMRALKNIDVAFICMNLPYTMTVEQAASAVREFKPRTVYPYHYRGSDVKKFQQIVGKDPSIEVRLRDWYAEP